MPEMSVLDMEQGALGRLSIQVTEEERWLVRSAALSMRMSIREYILTMARMTVEATGEDPEKQSHP